jgi:hypothetical protein
MELNYFLGSYIAPIAILLLNYFFRRKEGMKILDYIKVLIDVSIHLFGFAFFLLFLSYEKKIETGWTPISILTLNIPFFIILIFCYSYFKFYKKSHK